MASTSESKLLDEGGISDLGGKAVAIGIIEGGAAPGVAARGKTDEPSYRGCGGTGRMRGNPGVEIRK
jgi:hypothetical protein